MKKRPVAAATSWSRENFGRLVPANDVRLRWRESLQLGHKVGRFLDAWRWLEGFGYCVRRRWRG